VAPADDRVL